MFLFQALPPVRSKIKRISQDQKSKCGAENQRPARISGCDYASWDKFDVVSFILHLVINSSLANEASCARHTWFCQADLLLHENAFNKSSRHL
jgi:hypothetical protein